MNKSQQLVLRQLLKINVPLSIYEIAREVHITYPTAKKYIEDFNKQGLLDKTESKKQNVKGTTVYCYTLKKEFLQQIKEHMSNQQ